MSNLIGDFQNFVEEHSVEGLDPFFTLGAITGELGELANVAKKEVWYNRFSKYKGDVDRETTQGIRKPIREQKVDEAGDTLFYFLQYLNKEGITAEEVIAYQIDKINKQSVEYGCTYKK
jgi:NTP pyrophosphatase (non-canonical NTP hydrolase)